MKPDKRNALLQWINSKDKKQLKKIVLELIDFGVETESIWIRCPDEDNDRAIVAWESCGEEIGGDDDGSV